MREIKFRARRVGGSQEWVYFTLKSLLKVHTLDMNGTFKDWCEYTGLKDKNVVEIYESDIVAYDGDLDDTNAYYIIEWSNEMCGFLLGDDIPISDEEHLVIIGNIHMNPELVGV